MHHIHAVSILLAGILGCAYALEDPAVPAFPDEYSLQIEANMHHQNYTIELKEYYSKSLQASRVIASKNGFVTNTIISYNTGEMFQWPGKPNDAATFRRNNCNTSHLPVATTFNEEMLLDAIVSADEQQHIPLSVVLFKLTKNTTYIGTDEVRGIRVDCWRIEDIVFGTRTFSLTYYFTTSEWLPAAKYSQPVPVRILVEGSANDGSDDRPFLYFYDYVFFQPTVDDKTIFQTPPFLVCEDRNNTRELPNLGNSFKFREEIILPQINLVQYADVWYDFDSKMARYDFSISMQLMPDLYYPAAQYTEVHDFNTGLRYVMDHSKGNCSISALTDDSWDADHDEHGGAGAFITMKRPGDLLILNERYVYTGTRVMREIPVNVWVADVAVEHLPQVPGINVKSAIFDVAFSQGDAPEWVPGSLAHEEIIVATNARITYILEGSTEEATAFMTTNFYDFYMGMPLVTDFSIEECNIGVGNEMITKIYYNVIDGVPSVVADRKTSFGIVTTYTLAEIAEISPLRVAHVQVDYNEVQVFTTVTFINRPSSRAYYTMTPGPTTLDGGRITLEHGLASAKLCAQQCLAVAGDCVATAACTTTSSSTTVDCYFATAATPESSASQDLDEKCTLYTKANPSAKLEIDNAAVYAKLQEAIKMGELNIFLPEFLIDRHNTTMFVAVSIADVSPNSELSVYGAKFVESPAWNQINVENKAEAKRIFNAGIIQDCQRMCVDEEQFACKAVSMCGTNCVLLDTHLEEMNKTNTIIDTSCVGYSRIYTDGYQMFPGQIDRGDGTKLANISTVEVCAARCDNYIVFNCQSFEYCKVDKNCWLHEVHGFDVTSWNNASENCVHYSRNFLSAFQKYPRTRIHPNDPAIHAWDLSLEECAKSCAEDVTDFDCRSFEYCGPNQNEEKQACVLSGMNLQDSGVVTELTVDCDHYSRQYYLDGTPVQPDTHRECVTLVTFVDSGFSGGAMAWLAFFMLLAGAVIGIVVAAGLNRYKKSSHPNSFSSDILSS